MNDRNMAGSDDSADLPRNEFNSSKSKCFAFGLNARGDTYEGFKDFTAFILNAYALRNNVAAINVYVLFEADV